MNIQLQGTMPQRQTAVEKPEIAVNTTTPVEKVDKTTVVVENAKEKGQSGSSPEQQEQANNEQIKKAIEKLNKNMAHSEAVFGIHEGTNRVMIKIVDKDTKEVIKELPPEKTLDMIAKVWEMAGILVDERR